MKKTIFIVLMLTGLFQQQHSYAQTGGAERKKVSRFKISNPLLDCLRGLGFCITIGSWDARTVTFGIERINGKEQLCIYKEGMHADLLDELHEAREFPVESDVLLDSKMTTQLGFEGEILLVRGKYPITIQDDKFIIPVRIIHQ